MLSFTKDIWTEGRERFQVKSSWSQLFEPCQIGIHDAIYCSVLFSLSPCLSSALPWLLPPASLWVPLVWRYLKRAQTRSGSSLCIHKTPGEFLQTSRYPPWCWRGRSWPLLHTWAVKTNSSAYTHKECARPSKLQEFQAQEDQSLQPQYLWVRLSSFSYQTNFWQWIRFVFECPNDEASLLPITSFVYIKASDPEALKGPNGKPVVRPYTPISPPEHLGEITFLVKKYDTGNMSKYIHSLKVCCTDTPLLLASTSGRYGSFELTHICHTFRRVKLSQSKVPWASSHTKVILRSWRLVSS